MSKKQMTVGRLRKQGLEMVNKCIDLVYSGKYNGYCKVFYNPDNYKFYCGYTSKDISHTCIYKGEFEAYSPDDDETEFDYEVSLSDIQEDELLNWMDKNWLYQNFQKILNDFK